VVPGQQESADRGWGAEAKPRAGPGKCCLPSHPPGAAGTGPDSAGYNAHVPVVRWIRAAPLRYKQGVLHEGQEGLQVTKAGWAAPNVGSAAIQERSRNLGPQRPTSSY